MDTNVTEITSLKQSLDDLFLQFNGIIIMFMQCGFACLEAGAVRSKNTTNIIITNLMDMFFSCVAFWLVGYALAYGKGHPVIGWEYWANMNLPDMKMSHWFFQFCFAATAATIVTGAVAERCNFIAYIAYSSIISGTIYPVVVHWTWSDEGWLKTLGYTDFSGSGPIHLVGGVCSYWAALLIGPRMGRFGSKEDREELVGHSIPLMGLGGLLLTIGFLSFNGGSTGSISNPGEGSIVGRVLINTLLCGAGGSIIVLLFAKLGFVGARTWNFPLTLNAALTGMVSGCAALDKLDFWAGFVLGASAGIVYILLHYTMKWMLVDDPLDAVAVHVGGGLWGLMAGSFLQKGGIFYATTRQAALLFGYRMLGAGAIMLWSSVTSVLLFGTLKIFGKLRVSEEEERMGLDISMHNQPGYDPKGWDLPELQLPESEIQTHSNEMFNALSDENYNSWH